MEPLAIAYGVCGVYKITNRVNGKCYVGCSVDVRLRWVDHRARRHRNHHLSISRAFRKYGIDNFSFELLEQCTPEVLGEREIHWIAELRPEYNRTFGGAGRLGLRLSPEAKAILSRKGKEQWRKMTPEQQRQRVENNLIGPLPGHKRSWEMRQRISATLTGRRTGPFSQERKDAIRTGVLKRGPDWGVARWKQIAQVNDIGRVIWFWAAVKLAASELGIHPSAITAVLKGRRKHAGGFRWFYANVDASGPTDRPFYQEAKPL